VNNSNVHQGQFGISLRVKKNLVVNILKLPSMKTERVSIYTDNFKVEGPKHLVKVFEHDECEPTEYWIAHEHRPYQWDWEVKITKKAAMELKQYLEFVPGMLNL